MAVITDRITKTPGVCGGRACIAGHRIRVLDIATMYERQGLSPDEIVVQFPSITLSDVHTALVYYYDNREEIQGEIREEKRVVAEYLRKHPEALESDLAPYDLTDAH